VFTLPDWNKKTEIDFNRPQSACIMSMPARFDFIGGWTDTPPYYFDHDAAVLNATLELYRDKPESFEQNNDSKEIHIGIQPSGSFAAIENGELIPALDDHVIIRETLKYLGLHEPKIALSITNTIPKGSGLGGSSLLAASLLVSIWGYYAGIEYIQGHVCELINTVLTIEQLMESGGGWQDQIGGIFPGIKLIETTQGNSCHYSLKYLDKSIHALLNRNSLIIDSRILRKASRILYSIRQKYLDRDPAALKMLADIAVNARIGFRMLDEGNLADFASLLSESWLKVNEVEASSIESVEELKRVCGNDLIGVKIGGAGGGGFILAIFPDEEKREYYKRVIDEHFPESCLYYPLFGGSGMEYSRCEGEQEPFRKIEEMGYV
jgi:galactokinase/mevalonate kinase-like predicted kinase